MSAGAYPIHTMAKADLALALAWASDEGWNPGLADGPAFHAADPDGFLLARRDGVAAGCVSLVRYDDRYAFLGLYLVQPAFRGQGLGRALWQAALERGQGCVIGLDGVPARQDDYRAAGFVLAHRNLRFAGMAAPDPRPEPAVTELADLPFEQVLAYDRHGFPSHRPHFLKAWTHYPGGCALAYEGDDGELQGYGVLRPCVTGSRIGPLFADTPEIADALFRALRAAAPAGTPVYLDVPENQPQAMALAQRYGLQPQFETARMYRGDAPEVDATRIYGVTTFELG
ncbi:GNAT family N-acetyltransferase [Verticiella sediminum]|uniref:GNAT family N-acetyltransferase n=1 Tax=Verticiella sediminum TaxID=1247510 RepID=A0A556AQ77_9BURK|nr:GNAT family N-acetyltransferase [Verticiella sediminum]TSH95068.1 GNAT family N-acetyltransferase [Verticiella sediminum]